MILIAEKYSSFAPLYDLMSAEIPIYRAGRKLGVQSLDLRAGAQVIDVGCGTGLNFRHLKERIGLAGTIVGIDRSAEMLAQARRKATRHGWTNIILIQADATTTPSESIIESITSQGGRPLSDAALATYALSLMNPWEAGWNMMRKLTAPGGRLCIVDMQEPTSRIPGTRALARLACSLGGADITAHPWKAVEADCVDVTDGTARAGHLQIRTGRQTAT
ncbi:class I SAM-dependent methyltransferase [uncultured Arthrobacter sp.]|uniref:class I SAM-dependent methyltransferase n=1 Tax=uncultured Arthrobacter sp. TaxID=114050 RepID=UPI0025FEFA56|nr:methyltransferase domain-containing protein [uncultured Arthrobacter sp.]